jgi:hypothetical protein
MEAKRIASGFGGGINHEDTKARRIIGMGKVSGPMIGMLGLLSNKPSQTILVSAAGI